ncbi:nitrate ABC transporter ATP-binding protein, partial [Burkholderia sp. SIMBA_043]
MQNPTVINAPVQTSQPLQPPRLGAEILRVDHVSRGFNKTQGELLVLD